LNVTENSLSACSSEITWGSLRDVIFPPYRAGLWGS